jgi:hypothetical protein
MELEGLLPHAEAGKAIPHVHILFLYDNFNIFDEFGLDRLIWSR